MTSIAEAAGGPLCQIVPDEFFGESGSRDEGESHDRLQTARG